jgi:hypothetical protein
MEFVVDIILFIIRVSLSNKVENPADPAGKNNRLVTRHQANGCQLRQKEFDLKFEV